MDGQQLAMALRGAYLLFHRASQAQLVQIIEQTAADPDTADVTADQLLLLSVLDSQPEELTQRQLTDQNKVSIQLRPAVEFAFYKTGNFQ